jgi:hypothetical protein
VLNTSREKRRLESGTRRHAYIFVFGFKKCLDTQDLSLNDSMKNLYLSQTADAGFGLGACAAMVMELLEEVAVVVALCVPIVLPMKFT